MNLEERSVTIASMFAGVKYLHGNDVIHGDIKPANLLWASGVAKLTDFGSARISGESTRRPVTENYVAPETMAKGSVVLKESDIFCAGLVMFYVMVGEDFVAAGTVFLAAQQAC